MDEKQQTSLLSAASRIIADKQRITVAAAAEAIRRNPELLDELTSSLAKLRASLVTDAEPKKPAAKKPAAKMQ